jgi:hypothetical protein
MAALESWTLTITRCCRVFPAMDAPWRCLVIADTWPSRRIRKSLFGNSSNSPSTFCLTAEATYNQTETEFLIYNLGPEEEYKAETRLRLSSLNSDQVRCLMFFLVPSAAALERLFSREYFECSAICGYPKGLTIGYVLR